MLIYTVKPGDTLFKLARQYNLSAGAITNANGLENPDRLLVGQSLILPTAYQTHIVAAGESLYKIAQSYGVSLAELLVANPQLTNPNQIVPGMTLRLPQVNRGEITVGGYAYPNIRPQNLEEALRHLSFLNVFANSVLPDGTLDAPLDDQKVIATAKRANVQPRLVIANLKEGEGFQTEEIRKILEDPAKQETLLRSTVDRLKAQGYTGADVDFEYVPADAKESYNCFLAKARAWLHEEGYNLSAAVAPKTQDDQSGLLYAGVDFASHGRYDDYVILMTYEWGYQGGPAMAVAPLNEVRRVLDYAVTRIEPKKILMGIPNYGYDWVLPYAAGGKAKVVSNPEAINIAAAHGADIRFDETAKTPWYRYTDESGKQHEVWFEDARSIHAKLELVRKYNLGGVAYWTVNYPFPQNWYLVDHLFKVKKGM
ncbi:MAG: LysM peptidoglycan-binding domain-containing protein [Oscillospiraceae bacterium]|jgi:spore germination protein|nr:LysM peptidoglycan-binding domain-containing protein [Oscillospiraceae bacterium]